MVTAAEASGLLNAVLAAFPALAPLPAPLRGLLAAGLTPVAVPAGQRAFADGDPCRAFLLVLSGSVRVQKVGESGREIVLYRVMPGQTCVLTTNCLLAGEDYGAEGITETPVTAAALSVSTFQALLAQSADFRRFVFASFATRIADLLALIEDVAFGRIDQRLHHALWQRQRQHGRSLLEVTHQDLAVELGTAREVISRRLKDFERQGWLRLSRGKIELLPPFPPP